MICWQCMTKINAKRPWACSCFDDPMCDYSGERDKARADRFMALVAALSARDGYDPGEPVVLDALVTMREIERRVEAGTIFVEDSKP